ncbi:hypothetical protein [Candidatus Vidania fulgoroideorum]
MSKKAKNKIKLFNLKILLENYSFFFFKLNKFLKIFNYNFYYFIIKKKLLIFPKFNNSFCNENWCTYYSIIKNFIKGIKFSFSKKIVLKGIEYKVSKKNNYLILSVGFSHKKIIKIPKILKIAILNDKLIKINCFDNCILGNFCNKIISLKKYNLYKDKGIKFFNENKKIKERKKK